jgi:hypothetical protein
MERKAAELRARELNRDHPDRGTHVWLVGESEGGEWAVFRAELPPSLRRESLGTSVEQAPPVYTVIYERIPDSGT